MIQACSTSGDYVARRFEESSPEGIPVAVAHRGCWLREPDGEYYIPENSIYGVEMAKRFGYPAVEMDVKYTLDQKMVVMHDGTINRTMRNASDYSKIENPVRVSDCMFEDLRRDYVLESSDPAMRTPIPTLEEMLLACKKTGVIPMLHSKVLESYRLAQKILGDNWIAFEENYSALRYARSISDCLVLWDPGWSSAEATIAGLDEIGGWTGMSTMKYDMQDAAFIDALQTAGHPCQSSIFPAPHEQRSLHDGVAIELSDFFWFQTVGREAEKTIDEHLTLKAGERWSSPDFGLKEFAALTLRLDYIGSLELRVGNYVYNFSRPVPEKAVLGFRLYKSVPGIEIEAMEDINIKVFANIYEL